MLGIGSVSTGTSTEKRQQPQVAAEKRQKGGCVKVLTEEMRRRMAEGGTSTLTAAEIEQKVAEGGGYLRGFKPPATYSYEKYANDSDDELLPDHALPEHRPDFYHIWCHYHHQAAQTNGFDLDIYPGSSMLADVVPLDKSHTKYGEIMMELANLAIQQYNEKECNVFKYKLLSIEKVNYRLTGFEEYFMTVKVLNLTLGSSIETFQIHAGRLIAVGTKKVFSCLPKERGLLDGEGNVAEGKEGWTLDPRSYLITLGF
nr:uncharacterized protein LOC104118878 isoform X1 [Nicotiana tomentosiformis]